MEHFTVEMKPMGRDTAGKPIVGGIPVPNAKYNSRFDSFRRFYHNLYVARPYNEDPEKQFDLIDDPDTKLRFLALNSAWQVDQFNPNATLNNDALSTALRRDGKFGLGILVWHHAVTGDRKVADTDAIQKLAQAGYRILLHGDVHEDRDDLLLHLDPGSCIHVIGGGSFGASAQDRPESTPRLYSLLEVARDMSEIRVIRRRQKKPEGPYGPHAVYPAGEEGTLKHDYTIRIR